MKRLKILVTLTAVALFAFAAVACGDATSKIEKITVRAESQTVYTGGTLTLTADVEPTEAKDKGVIWSIESGATATGATVSHTGVFAAGYVAGTCIVRATSQSDPSVYGTMTLTVEEPREAVPVTGIAIDGDETRWVIIGSGTISLTAAIQPADADNQGVVWSLIDAGGTQASISADGAFAPGDLPGDVVVQAASAENLTLNDKITIRIAPALTDVSINGSDEIKVGGSSRFTIASQPVTVDAVMFTWTVDETDLPDGGYTFSNGVFTSEVAGYAVISVRYKADENISATKVLNINHNVTRRFAVTFTDENDNVIDVQSVAEGGAAQAPEYIVLGKEVSWNIAFDNINSDLTVKAVLDDIEYTVSYFKPNAEGEWEAISVGGETVQNVAFGKTAVAPAPDAYAVDGKLFVNWRVEKDGNAYALYAEYKDIAS